ncbi:hypothetical protein QK129_003763 [Yersinia enterocolitica]|uniref:hypothetical protein n=1 Tax=Yersinia ruckeri TaxID=29486 RepID=UPI002238DF75|nr:hypothetical protein [Yersinia ruckeri]ELX2238800.1 hypothetical protein [Yersinia enterocolitica]MCW6572910.1 hypothetical protein [Yersinia ruckeri]HDL7537452.1 hypothetical protein [Yersinia enterocolitica]
MNYVKVTVNNNNEFMRFDLNDNANNFILLFYGLSHDNVEEATKSYAEQLRLQGYSVIYTPTLSNRSFGANDYVLLDSASIVSCEDADMSIRIIHCGDNLIASIHAVDENEAILRINNLAKGYRLLQVCSHGHLCGITPPTF